MSKDPSTKVGAIIVNPQREIVATGFNGFPRGVLDADERYADRPTKYRLIVHAEVNAILTARERAAGGTLYVWPSFGDPPVCTGCAKTIIQAGIREIVSERAEVDEATRARWAEELDWSRLMLAEAGVLTRVVE